MMLDGKLVNFHTLTNKYNTTLKRKGAWITPENCECWYVWDDGVCVRPSHDNVITRAMKEAIINSAIKYDPKHFAYLRHHPPNSCYITLYPDENAGCGLHADDEELFDTDCGIFSFSLGRSTFFDIISQQFWNAVMYI